MKVIKYNFSSYLYLAFNIFILFTLFLSFDGLKAEQPIYRTETVKCGEGTYNDKGVCRPIQIEEQQGNSVILYRQNEAIMLIEGDIYLPDGQFISLAGNLLCRPSEDEISPKLD